jgi:hypothetical protein
MWYHFSGYVSHLLVRQPRKTVGAEKANTRLGLEEPGILICLNQEKMGATGLLLIKPAN